MPPILVGALPKGSSPLALPLPHFPSRLHAYIWRNWQLVPVKQLGKVIGASAGDILKLAAEMGVGQPPRITSEHLRRSYITIIRRNWHLLPYDQLLELLGWSPEQMAFTLREDDFLFIKLGNLKPACAPLRYEQPDEKTSARAKAIGRIVQEEFHGQIGEATDPLFSFVERLSSKPRGQSTPVPIPLTFRPRFCYSYFALYGDPLLDEGIEPYPEGYLARMADTGVTGVWLQGVLQKLAPFHWDTRSSEFYQKRLRKLRELAARAHKYGIGIYLYLNEPRSMPLSFFQERPELKGAVEGDHAALCTSAPDVQQWLRQGVASICRAVPNLAGFFTITVSENLTNCWSHGQGANCPRCGKRGAAEVIAEVNGLFQQGIKAAGSQAQLIVWDWGWAENWAAEAIHRLPDGVMFMSVSEWDLPINRGGVPGTVGEYSISAVGPGPRARKHWELARKRGLKTAAKIQAGNTWELSAVPYIPALENVARHAANLCQEQVDGLMLGWTLGGYPSPNLEVVAEIGAMTVPDVEQALQAVARRRFGAAIAPAVVKAGANSAPPSRNIRFTSAWYISRRFRPAPATCFGVSRRNTKQPWWESPMMILPGGMGYTRPKPFSPSWTRLPMDSTRPLKNSSRRPETMLLAEKIRPWRRRSMWRKRRAFIFAARPTRRVSPWRGTP